VGMHIAPLDMPKEEAAHNTYPFFARGAFLAHTLLDQGRAV